MKSFLLFCAFLSLAFSVGLAQPASVRIGLMADAHVPTMHDSERRISAFIDSMKIARPDFIVDLGDFLIPSEKYAASFAVWNSYPGRRYHVIGNHEMDGGTTLQQALAYRGMTSSYYSFTRNGFQFIVLDGNDKKFPEQKGYQEHIGPAQLAWLKGELQKAESPIVLFSHQGLGSGGVDNASEIRALLEAHNARAGRNKVIVDFYGHLHHDVAEEINGIWYVCINSLSYKWLGEEYPHIRYSAEIDKQFKWIKYTAPYKDPLYTVVEISTDGTIRIAGKKSEWVGPSPWDIGYPQDHKAEVVPWISARELHFKPINR